MKNFIELVEKIKIEFSRKGFENKWIILEQIIIEGGTIGEKFAGISFHLNNVKKNKYELYGLAKNEIDEIINYAKSINYLS